MRAIVNLAPRSECGNMWTDARLIIFILATVLIAYISRDSLSRPRSHGFYRFFVFEIDVALILLSVPVWFRDPWSWHQVISWVLLTVSFIPLITGVRALHVYGRQDVAVRHEPGLIGFERTSRLVSEGVFHYIRHPMYSSLLLLTWGLFFKEPSMIGIGLSLLATVGLVMMARLDERECVQVFGEAYRDYMRGTRRFIPLVY